MDKHEQRLLDLIDSSREAIISFAKSIKGENGFREYDTAKKVQMAFCELGLSVNAGLAETGVKGEKQFSSGPKLAIIGELDGITCPAHKNANPENGVAHACGHSAQLAAIYGAAIALCRGDIENELSGSAVFFAVPAEEFIPLSSELNLRGITEPAGKPELIKRGEFDDISAAVVTHVHMLPAEEQLVLGLNACCGFTAKTVTIRGIASHAAAAPHLGVNALNAASLALNAIGLLRETFLESDCIRIHTNIVKGGTALNVIPDEIVVKSMIRGITEQAISSAAEKFDNAFIHCAKALSAIAEIKTEKGYIPTPYLQPFENAFEYANALHASAKAADERINFASTDVGFLTQCMPVLAFTHGGASGALHSVDFEITNEDEAYIIPAKLFALTAYNLLKNNAEGLSALRTNFDALKKGGGA